MMRTISIIAAALAVAILAGCGGSEAIEVASPVDINYRLFTGPFWHLLTMLAVLFVAYLVNQKGEANEDSLFKLGNRLRNLEDRLEEMQKAQQAAAAPAPKAEAAKATTSSGKKASKKKASKKKAGKKGS